MGQVGAAGDNSPKPQRAFSREVQSKAPSIHLPKGLVGTKTSATVNIAGREMNCLLDTGSQVTTVPQSFYEKHLSDLPINPLGDLLDVECANG